MFTDKTLPCRTCGKNFLFTAGEQQYFHSHGLTNDPKRCANCRVVRRSARSGMGIANVFDVSCAECGTPTTVPFEPKGYKPVYCNQCHLLKKRESASAVLSTSSNSIGSGTIS